MRLLKIIVITAINIFKVDNQQEATYSTWNSAQHYVAAWKGGGLGENGCVCVYDCVPSLSTRNYRSVVNWLHANTK